MVCWALVAQRLMLLCSVAAGWLRTCSSHVLSCSQAGFLSCCVLQRFWHLSRLCHTSLGCCERAVVSSCQRTSPESFESQGYPYRNLPHPPKCIMISATCHTCELVLHLFQMCHYHVHMSLTTATWDKRSLQIGTRYLAQALDLGVQSIALVHPFLAVSNFRGHASH